MNGNWLNDPYRAADAAMVMAIVVLLCLVIGSAGCSEPEPEPVDWGVPIEVEAGIKHYIEEQIAEQAAFRSNHAEHCLDRHNARITAIEDSAEWNIKLYEPLYHRITALEAATNTPPETPTPAAPITTLEPIPGAQPVPDSVPYATEPGVPTLAEPQGHYSVLVPPAMP